MKIKFSLITVLLLLTYGFGSCQYSGPVIFLERGKSIDLEKIDLQTASPDKIFSKLAYIKEYRFGRPKKTYTGDSPLILHKYALYNIKEARMVDRYLKKETDTIKKGDLYGDTTMIERTVPPLGLKNRDMTSFGYWENKEIAFNSIYTGSTLKDKLFMVRFESDNIKGVTLKTYQNLLGILKKKYPGAEFKEQPQSDGLSNYEWRMKDKIMEIRYQKDGDRNYLYFTSYFLNADTKGYLKQFGH